MTLEQKNFILGFLEISRINKNLEDLEEEIKDRISVIVDILPNKEKVQGIELEDKIYDFIDLTKSKYFDFGDTPYFLIIGLTLAKTVSQVDLLSDELKDDEFDKKENKTFYKNSFNTLSKLDSLEVWENLDKFYFEFYPDHEEYDVDEANYKIDRYMICNCDVCHTKFKFLNEKGETKLKFKEN